MKLHEWLTETRRKVSHGLVGLAMLVAIILIPDRFLLRLGAGLLVFLAGLHWYVQKRYLRRKKFKEALVDLKKSFGEELSWEEKQGLKDFNHKEENFFRKIMALIGRKGEEIVMPAFYYFFGCLMSYILFGKYALIFGIIALGAGDAAATLAGRQFGKHKIFWNTNKSWEGFFAFILATFFACLLFLELVPSYALITPWKLAGLAAITGALVETIPILEDNATVPFVVSLVLWLAYHYVWVFSVCL